MKTLNFGFSIGQKFLLVLISLGCILIFGIAPAFGQQIKSAEPWDGSAYSKYLEKGNSVAVVFASVDREDTTIFIALDNNRDGFRDATFTLASGIPFLVVDIKVKDNDVHVLTIDGRLTIFDLTGKQAIRKYDGINLGQSIEVFDNGKIVGTGFNQKLVSCSINKKNGDVTIPRNDKLSSLGVSGTRSLNLSGNKLFFSDFAGGIKSAVVSKDGLVDESSIVTVFTGFSGVDIDLDSNGDIFIIEPEQFFQDGSSSDRVTYVIKKEDPTFARALFFENTSRNRNFSFLSSIAVTKDGRMLFMSSPNGLTLLSLDENKEVSRVDVFVESFTSVTAIAVVE